MALSDAPGWTQISLKDGSLLSGVTIIKRRTVGGGYAAPRIFLIALELEHPAGSGSLEKKALPTAGNGTARRYDRTVRPPVQGHFIVSGRRQRRRDHFF